MDPATQAFVRQIERDHGDNTLLIALIERGQRFVENGVDVTAERLSDARRRKHDAAAIIRAYT